MGVANVPEEKEYVAKYLPVFLVVDTSASMGWDREAGERKLIEVANELVPTLVNKCDEFPTLDQKLRLSLIEFNSDASVRIALSESDSFRTSVPTLTASGTTDYGRAFARIYDEINVAVPSLAGPKIGVFRPTVFFITDGEDNGDQGQRDQAWDKLVDPSFKLHPNFFTFGVAEATKGLDELKRFKSGHGLVAVAKDPDKAVEGLTEIMNKLVQSIVSSSTGEHPTGNVVLDRDDFDPDNWDLLD